jgi:hypothetical protein
MTGEDIDEWFMQVWLRWVRKTQDNYRRRVPAKQPPPIESPQNTYRQRVPAKQPPPIESPSTNLPRPSSSPPLKRKQSPSSSRQVQSSSSKRIRISSRMDPAVKTVLDTWVKHNHVTAEQLRFYAYELEFNEEGETLASAIVL